MSAEETTTTPASQPDESLPPADIPAFGWTAYAEKINGRFAMIGFILLLLLEGISQQTFWAWLGLG
jgi:hypothetical protein